MPRNTEKDDVITADPVDPTGNSQSDAALGARQEAKYLGAMNRAKSRSMYNYLQAPEQVQARVDLKNRILQEAQEVLGEKGLEPTVFTPTEDHDPEQAEAQTSLAGRDQTLLKAMVVLGLGEGFRPTTTTFLNKLHSNTSSDAGSFHPAGELKSNSPSTSYSYSDIRNSSDTSITLPPINVSQAPLKVIFPDPPSPPQLGSHSQSSHMETHDDSSVGQNSMTSVHSSVLSSIHTTSQNSVPKSSKLESIKTDTMTRGSSLRTITYSRQSPVAKKGTVEVLTTKTLFSQNKTRSPASIPTSHHSKSNFSEFLSEASSSSRFEKLTFKNSKNSNNSSKSTNASSSSVHESRTSTHSAKSITQNQFQKSSNFDFSTKSTKASPHSQFSRLSSPLPKNSSIEFLQQPPLHTSHSFPSISTALKSHVICQNDTPPPKGESVSDMKSLSAQRIHISYTSSSSHTKSYSSKSVPARTDSLTSSASSSPSHLALGEKGTKPKDMQSIPHNSQNSTPSYSYDDFISEEGEEKKESPSLSQTQQSSRKKISRRIAKPRKLYAIPREKKPRPDFKERRPHYSNRAHHHSCSIPLTFDRGLYEATKELTNPVASLVTHCVAVNDQIYNHALRFAMQIQKKHSEKAGSQKPRWAEGDD